MISPLPTTPPTNTPAARMMTLLISRPFPVPLSEWVTSAEPYWSTLAERPRPQSLSPVTRSAPNRPQLPPARPYCPRLSKRLLPAEIGGSTLLLRCRSPGMATYSRPSIPRRVDPDQEGLPGRSVPVMFRTLAHTQQFLTKESWAILQHRLMLFMTGAIRDARIDQTLKDYGDIIMEPFKNTTVKPSE